MEKVRLGGDHPDYHTLLAALTQILEGLIINAWRTKCGHGSLDDFAQSKPTAEAVLALARKLISKYAAPREILLPTTAKPKQSPLQNMQENICTPQQPGSDESSGSGAAESETEETSTASNTMPAPPDNIHNNVILFTRDLLYVVELVDAISAGDFGRVEDILPDLACVFRGAGSNNYSTEILHLLFNLKEVWTPKFANIMRDAMLVNPSGIPGHAMGMDLNIEHLIRYLKVNCDATFIIKISL